MDINSVELIPDCHIPADNSNQIKFMRLKLFEKDLKEAGIDFVYSDDIMLEAGLIAGGIQALYREYALEVYRLCTSDLSLPHQKKYDEFLDFIQTKKSKPNYYREYHFNGDEEGISKTELFKTKLMYLFDFSDYVGHDVLKINTDIYGLLSIGRDCLLLNAYGLFDFYTGHLLIEEEILFYLLLRTDEIMENFDFYLK